MKTKSCLTLVWAILGASLTVGLIACGGGGGGGGGLSYSGLATQALITEDNASELAVGAWLSGDTGTNIDIFGAVKAEQEFPNNSFSLGLMPFIFEDVIDLIEIPHGNTQPYLGAVQQIDQPPMYGTCGGSASFTGSADDETGAINATVNFENYCEDGIKINGLANLSGTIDLSTEELSYFTLSFSTLTLEESGESLTINGSFSANYAVTPMLVTMSYVLRDNNLMKTYWLSNAQFQLDGQMDYVDITGLSGRYYDPAYGYVDLSVGQTIHISDYANWPSSGSIVLTGAAGSAGGKTKSRLVFLDANEYRIDADTNGDGAYDYTEGPYSWTDEVALVDPYLFSENTAFSDFFVDAGLSGSYFMRALVKSDIPGRTIYINNNTIDEQVPYVPSIDLLFAPYFSYVKTFLPPYDPPGSLWEGKTYIFFTDENNNGLQDYGEPFRECTVPPGAIRPLPIPDVSVTGDSFPTISWQAVSGADNYFITIFTITQQNRLGNLVFTVKVDDDGSSSFSYTYNGDLFSQYSMLAIGVVAREEYSSCVLNRSLYYTVHSK